MIWVWIGAALIGLTLGLLGSGGSILTVPVLVYLAGEPAKVAIAESLAIVGAIALVGAVPYARQRSIDGRSAVFFGLPGVAGTYGGAALSAYVSAAVQLVLFAGVMLLAAALMFRGRPDGERAARRQPAAVIVLEGLLVGVLTGLVGVGGGFLIVPALVLLGGLPMRVAVGTSLVIIAVKSFVGFAKYLDVLAGDGLAVDWGLIVLLSVIGMGGSLAGNVVSRRVPQAALRRGFAAFLVVMGAFILWREAPALLPPSADPPSSETVTIDTVAMLSFFRKSAAADTLSPAACRDRFADGATMLDVRTPGEFAQGHLACATHADVMAPDFRERVEALGLDRERPVYVYCRSGNRSGRAAKVLREMGFREAYNVGGYEALLRAGFERASASASGA